MRTRIISILVVAFMMIASAMVLTSCNQGKDKTDSKSTEKIQQSNTQSTNQQGAGRTKSEIAEGSYGKTISIPYEKVAPFDKSVSGISCAVKEGDNVAFYNLASEVDQYRSKFGVDPKVFPVQMRCDLTQWVNVEMNKEKVGNAEYYVVRVPLAGYSYDIIAWCTYLGDDRGGNDKYLQDSYWRDHLKESLALSGYGANRYGGGNQYYSQLK
ncbi:MAG: hypothetical protein NTY12_03270 [Candidatus Falkowbacteria bacterium]|nr:hypothetical protein [Candidatus Falkowbacteria bacterium]